MSDTQERLLIFAGYMAVFVGCIAQGFETYSIYSGVEKTMADGTTRALTTAELREHVLMMALAAIPPLTVFTLLLIWMGGKLAAVCRGLSTVLAALISLPVGAALGAALAFLLYVLLGGWGVYFLNASIWTGMVSLTARVLIERFPVADTEPTLNGGNTIAAV